MVKMNASYSGGLHCELVHGPSGSSLETDAPKDNQGKGEKFSPTDLVGAALASCILTTMAIAAQKDGISLEGAKAQVEKEMTAVPKRRIAGLSVQVTLPASVPAGHREKLERIGRECPVQQSIHPDVRAPITFRYE